MKVDNSKNRLLNVFFYGLYMDPDILELKGVKPRNPRKASVENYILKIGERATLLRSQGQATRGMVYSINHQELNLLYWGAGLTEYAAEVLLVKTENPNKGSIPVLCCNLIEPPDENETNPDYEQKLNAVLHRLGLSND